MINEIRENFERLNQNIILQNSKKTETKVQKIYDKIPKEHLI